MAAVINLNVEELRDFIEERGVCEEIAENFERIRISGKAFLKLTEDDVKELVPIIGVRREILKEYKEVSKVCNTGLDFKMINGFLTHLFDLRIKLTSQREEQKATPQESDWHLSFQIPRRETFSQCVKHAIDSGIVSSKARQQIITTIRTLCLQHTR